MNINEIGIRLKEKIRRFNGDVVFIEPGQIFFIRNTMTDDEIKKSCRDGLDIAEKLPSKKLIGQFGAIYGKLLVQVAMTNPGEQIPHWRNPEFMNKPATFPMTAEEREVLNNIDRRKIKL